MSDSVIGLLSRQLEEYKSSIELWLAQGGAKSYEDYLKMTAKYEAFEQIEQEVKELEKRYIEMQNFFIYLVHIRGWSAQRQRWAFNHCK